MGSRGRPIRLGAGVRKLVHALRTAGRWALFLARRHQPDWLKSRARLQEERDHALRQARIWEAVAAEDDLRLRVEYAHNGLHAEMNGKIKGLRTLCAEARGLLKDAPNYVECFMRDDLGELVLTIQKREGLTPNERRLAAEAERDALRGELEALRE